MPFKVQLTLKVAIETLTQTKSTLTELIDQILVNQKLNLHQEYKENLICEKLHAESIFRDMNEENNEALAYNLKQANKQHREMYQCFNEQQQTNQQIEPRCTITDPLGLNTRKHENTTF